MTFLEQFPPFLMCCLCINLRTGCILTAIYFILESICQIIGKAVYLAYDNPYHDGKVNKKNFFNFYYKYNDDAL